MCLFDSLTCMMQTERLSLRNRVEKKAAYLQELEDQVRYLLSFPSCSYEKCRSLFVLK